MKISWLMNIIIKYEYGKKEIILSIFYFFLVRITYSEKMLLRIFHTFKEVIWKYLVSINNFFM